MKNISITTLTIALMAACSPVGAAETTSPAFESAYYKDWPLFSTYAKETERTQPIEHFGPVGTPQGLHRCLGSLFKVTPPDAILVDDWILLLAVQNYLSHKRGAAFRHVECVSMDYHPSLKWCEPVVPHFYWDPAKAVQRVVQWVDHVAQGKDDRKVKLIEAKFIPGRVQGMCEM